MNTLIPGTNRTPTVSFQNGNLAISGRSYMENSVEFYAPIKKLVDEYNGPINVEIGLDFFNTSSSKCLMDLLTLIDKKCVSGHECKIRWSYKADDEDMKDSAEEFRDVLRHVTVELEEIDD
ncbi:MAG: DUF1987 domain-containing protein [Bacteroidales bacterium]|nr:DUF1987 domain-containing protein [Bacteroidales bacterium]